MQFFYIDESEGGGRSEFDDLYIIGAVSLDERQLVAAEAGVRSLDEDVFGTRQANQIREFHGHELYSGKGLFRQIPPADRIKICHRLIDIVEKNDLSIGYVCINKRKSIANKHPHQLAFLLLLERIEDLMKSISQTALIVADENDKIEQRLVDDLEFYKTQDTSWGWRPTKIEHVVDSIHFVRSKHNRVMQLTDVICNVALHGISEESSLLDTFLKSQRSLSESQRSTWPQWFENFASPSQKANAELWGRLKNRCKIAKSFPG